MPKISFVVTVFNKAPFLPAVIDGLKAQTGAFDREFIFIDDGSSDSSVEIIRSETAGLENVRIVAQENHGPAIATNNAVSIATGDWIKLVDSDDVLAPYCTELLLSRALADDLDFIFGSADYYDMQTGPVFPQTDLASLETILFDDPLFTVLDRGFARVSHCLFKRQVFERAGGCDPRIFSQDHSLFIRLAALGKLGQIKHVVCLGPEDEPGRIMNNQAQVIHDASIALAYFLKDQPDLPASKRKLIAKKVLSRVRKWEKKKLGKGGLGPAGKQYVLSRLGVPVSGDVLVSLCSAFGEGSVLRIPQKTDLPELKDISHEP
ncbi:glycosyltransferase family 2 protein [Thalassospira lucentensis]|uniref:glycosyltransferase family 2 protein n=1 Tax=Thalassospira lucentensis TaxID=168935 RepID=UPI003D2F1A5C